MKKFLRRTIPLLIPILLLALFSRVPLAQPEQTVPEEPVWSAIICCQTNWCPPTGNLQKTAGRNTVPA